MVNVSVLSRNPAMVNCSIVTGARRSLIVDSGPGPETARLLARRAVELSTEHTGGPAPIDLVITHDHWDHFFGAAELVVAGVERVFAAPTFAVDQMASAWLALDALRRDPATSDFAAGLPSDPNAFFVDVTEIDQSPTIIDLGGAAAELHVLGGHSTADVAVRLPEAGIVFTGDLIEESAPPQAGGDASLSEWVASLHALLAMPEATVFVPGHGVPVDRDFVARQAADIDELRGRQSDTEVALPGRVMPGAFERAVPREIDLI